MNTPTRIKAPKYKVGKYSLNEYELRALMFEVAINQQPTGIKVKDLKGREAEILADGRLSNNLYGLDITSSYTLKQLKFNRTGIK